MQLRKLQVLRIKALEMKNLFTEISLKFIVRFPGNHFLMFARVKQVVKYCINCICSVGVKLNRMII